MNLKKFNAGRFEAFYFGLPKPPAVSFFQDRARGGQYRCEESYGKKFPKRVTPGGRLPCGSDMLSRVRRPSASVRPAAVRSCDMIEKPSSPKSMLPHNLSRWLPPSKQTGWPVVSLDRVDNLGEHLFHKEALQAQSLFSGSCECILR